MPIEKIILMSRFVIKETSLNIDCLAGFCHCLVTTMSAHVHAFCHSVFESGFINNCFRRNIQIRTKNNTKVDFAYNDD